MAVQLRLNAASVLSEGRSVGTYCKRELPNYQVFDERRYFASGRDSDLPALTVELAAAPAHAPTAPRCAGQHHAVIPAWRRVGDAPVPTVPASETDG